MKGRLRDDMIVKGFRFGLLLQLAVGPVFVFVLNQASTGGFASGMAAVAAVTLVDAAYIGLATAGISRLAALEKHRKPFTIIGAAVILVFSVDILLGAVSRFSLIPRISGMAGRGGAFGQALLLAVSNPLTILFWSGVFSARIAEDQMDAVSMFRFGLGAVLSTVVFLALIAGAGVLLHDFLPPVAMKVLNIAVALFLLYFAVMKIVQAGKKA